MDINKFYKKVDTISSPNGCWLWTGKAQHKFGYGRFYGTVAHRASWILHIGPLTSKECVLHKCDNPKCVNPAHLFIGSRADNARDRVSKDRTPKGVEKSNSIFTEQQIRDIRSSTKSTSALAKEYGVKYGTMWTIIKRLTWKHI